MRPVNLLPAQHRPRVASGGLSGSAYAVVAILGVVLVAVLAYALTANRVNSLKEETLRVESEASDAEARAEELAPFAAFRQVKATRELSVSTLAQSRLDWERLSQELARVLPPEAWLSKVEASTLPQATTAAAAAEQDAHTGPTVTLSGCAKSQPVVARMLVRLRRLNGAEDVKLGESAKAAGEGTTGSAAGGSSSAGTSGTTGATGTEGCGDLFTFEATVELAPASPLVPTQAGPTASAKVPAALGGGP